MKHGVFFIVLVCCWIAADGLAAPLGLHPENPRYFQFHGKPIILVTSGEHYGAVLNLDFSYTVYLDELSRHRFNLARIFSDTYREVAGPFNITGNTLAPAAGRFVFLWPCALGIIWRRRKIPNEKTPTITW